MCIQSIRERRSMSGAPKIASASASGARKKNSERERERRSEKSGSASGERRSSNLRKIFLKVFKFFKPTATKTHFEKFECNK